MEFKAMPPPRGSAARPGYPLAPQYVTIHNTANTGKGAGAESHGRYLQGAGSGKAVSYHYVVDSGLTVQIIPDNEVAWHAGDGARGPGNRRSLAIEICENPESSLREATDAAAVLTAALLARHGIPLSHVVQHNHWSGKNCPRRIRAGEPYGWGDFLARVAEAAGGNAQAGQSAPDTKEEKPMTRVFEVFSDKSRQKVEVFGGAPDVNQPAFYNRFPEGLPDGYFVVAEESPRPLQGLPPGAGSLAAVQIMVEDKRVWAPLLSGRTRIRSLPPEDAYRYFVLGEGRPYTIRKAKG